MKTNSPLWSRITSFHIDRGNPDFTFRQRLARENAWTHVFAERVVHEYFRFVYLSSVSATPVTPSVAVDQAWHLHLCYTRSYWTELCQNVLARPLHHGPTQGGEKEDQRYLAQYEHTLRLYEDEFGHAPPQDIWPPAKLRFSPNSNPFSVSRDRFVVLEKASLRKAGRLAGLAAAGLMAAGAAASSSDGFVTVIVILLIIGLVAWSIARRGDGGKGGPGSCGSSCGSSGSSSAGSSKSNAAEGGKSGCGSGDEGGGGGDGDGGGCGGGGD